MTKLKRTYAFSFILIFSFFTIIGLLIIPSLSYKLNPSQSLQVLNIECFWKDANPKTIENAVTYKLEQVFSTLENLTEINSYSNKGKSTIGLKFEESADIEKIRLQISSKIRQIYPSFPRGVSYPKITNQGANDNNTETLMTLSISGESSLEKLSNIVIEDIIPKLSKIKQVNKVEAYGLQKYQLEIICNEQKLKDNNIKRQELIENIKTYFLKNEVGNLQVENNTLGISVNGRGNYKENNQIEQFDRIPVSVKDGKLYYLGDFAEVVRKPIEKKSYKKFNGLNSITINLETEKKSNQIQVSEEINSLIENYNNNLIKIHKLYDSTIKLKEELKKISLRTLLSVSLLLIFVFLINRNIYYLLIIFFSLISNLSIAAILYFFFSVDIHIYSLAGLTISLGIIIDNSIIVIDHLLNKKNKSVFLSILATTFTTIGALSIIFFIKKEHQLYLLDFSWVIILNLIVSVFVALFLIPALQERLNLKNRKTTQLISKRKRIIFFTNWYYKLLGILIKKRVLVFIVFLFLFGIPLFLVDENTFPPSEKDKVISKAVKSDFYKKYIANNSKYIGGTLYTFLKKNEKGFFFSKPGQLTLQIRLSGPEEMPITQMDKAIENYESLLKTFDKIEMFTTEVYNSNNAIVKAFIKKDYEKTDFPYSLKSKLEAKANQIGGVNSSIFGIGQGFSNSMNSISDATIKLTGFELNQLNQIANHIKDSILLKHSRINNVKINSEKSWILKDKFEYMMFPRNEALSMINSQNLYDEIYWFSGNNSFVFEFDGVPVYINSSSQKVDLFQLKAKNINIDSTSISLNDVVSLKKEKVPLNIVRKNKQYQLFLDYSFAGTYEHSNQVLEELIESINEEIPIGYRAFDINDYEHEKKDKFLFLKIILLILLIIFFICAILFESLIQPLAVIITIPASFIGVFITFSIFDVQFDQGGFASFILLSGIVVNSSIYIINEYNTLKYKSGNNLKRYLSAYNSKIIPILLTIISTIIGLLPFILYDGNDFFWTAFAYGNIGGLLFSIIVLLFLLPLCLNLKNNKID